MKQLEPVQARLEHERVQAVPLHDVGGPHVHFAELGGALRHAARRRDVPRGFLARGLVAVTHAGARPAAVDAGLARLGTPLVGRGRRHRQRVRQAAEVRPLAEVRPVPRGDVLFLQDEPRLQQRLRIRDGNGAGADDADRLEVLRPPDGAEAALARAVAGVVHETAVRRLVLTGRPDAQHGRRLGRERVAEVFRRFAPRLLGRLPAGVARLLPDRLLGRPRVLAPHASCVVERHAFVGDFDPRRLGGSSRDDDGVPACVLQHRREAAAEAGAGVPALRVLADADAHHVAAPAGRRRNGAVERRRADANHVGRVAPVLDRLVPAEIPEERRAEAVAAAPSAVPLGGNLVRLPGRHVEVEDLASVSVHRHDRSSYFVVMPRRRHAGPRRFT